MKTPDFWYRPEKSTPSLQERLFEPFSLIYAAGSILHRNLTKPKACGIPVLCVGNIIAGGAGKTPVALALMTLVKSNALAKKPVFLTRGHGGLQKGPLQVDSALHRFHDVGDEALLLAQTAPTIISRNRWRGAETAVESGKDLIIMDDGFQNRQLAKSINIVVIDGTMGFGNRKLLPAGPLRESLNKGLLRADAFVLIGQDERNIRAILPSHTPVFEAHLALAGDLSLSRDRAYIAFAGLGYPEKFFKFLRQSSLNIKKTIPFPDHHPYTDDDLQKLKNMAKLENAQLITTTKDWVRLPPSFKNDIESVPVILKWVDEDRLVHFIKQYVTL